MPFVSQAQRGFMYVHHPKLAKEFEKKTPKGKKLPKHVKGKKASPKPPTKPQKGNESARVPVTTMLFESGAAAAPRVDRERGVIRDVCILGPVSAGPRVTGKPRRVYSEEAMRNAVPLYEGAMVNIDHPLDHNPNVDRESDKRFGKLVNCRYEAGQIRGDLVFLTTHPMAQRVMEAAADPNKANLFGMSQAFDYDATYDSAGVEQVTKIKRVLSVDLVADPATTRSLFESSRSQPMDGNMMNDGGVAVEQPEAPEAEDGIESHPLDAICDDICKKFLAGEMDAGAAVAKFKQALKLFEEDKEGGEEEEKDGESEESACEGKEKGEESAKSITTADFEAAVEVLEAAGVTPTKPRIRAVAMESAANRKALAETWKETTTEGAKPRSGTGKPESHPKHGTESSGGDPSKPPTAEELKARARRVFG